MLKQSFSSLIRATIQARGPSVFAPRQTHGVVGFRDEGLTSANPPQSKKNPILFITVLCQVSSGNFESGNSVILRLRKKPQTQVFQKSSPNSRLSSRAHLPLEHSVDQHCQLAKCITNMIVGIPSEFTQLSLFKINLWCK